MTTQDRIGTALDQAVEQARDTTGHRRILAAVVALAAGLIVVAVMIGRGWTTINELEDQAAENATAAQMLAAQVRALGGTPAVQPPAVGERGDAGPAGRGIAGTSIVAGRLLLAYSDGTTEDKGPVVGEAGAPGPQGEEGRGVVGTAITNGRLVLSYSDSTTEDVGQVVGAAGAPGADGAPGRGVASVEAVGGRLVVTYSDGTSVDAGPLPAGPAGRGVQRAEVVDCRWRVTYTDGTTEDAGSACTTETVTAPAPTTTAPTPEPPLLPLGG